MRLIAIVAFLPAELRLVYDRFFGEVGVPYYIDSAEFTVAGDIHLSYVNRISKKLNGVGSIVGRGIVPCYCRLLPVVGVFAGDQISLSVPAVSAGIVEFKSCDVAYRFCKRGEIELEVYFLAQRVALSDKDFFAVKVGIWLLLINECVLTDVKGELRPNCSGTYKQSYQEDCDCEKWFYLFHSYTVILVDKKPFCSLYHKKAYFYELKLVIYKTNDVKFFSKWGFLLMQSMIGNRYDRSLFTSSISNLSESKSSSIHSNISSYSGLSGSLRALQRLS